MVCDKEEDPHRYLGWSQNFDHQELILLSVSIAVGI